MKEAHPRYRYINIKYETLVNIQCWSKWAKMEKITPFEIIFFESLFLAFKANSSADFQLIFFHEF